MKGGYTRFDLDANLSVIALDSLYFDAENDQIDR